MCKTCQLLVVAALCLLPTTTSLSQAAPVPKERADAGIENTEWVGMDGPEKHITTFRFEKGGVLAYYYNGTSYRNGTWKQDGKKLYFEMNDKYRETEATIDGEVITSKSWNTAGAKWETTMYKYNKPEAEKK